MEGVLCGEMFPTLNGGTAATDDGALGGSMLGVLCVELLKGGTAATAAGPPPGDDSGFGGSVKGTLCGDMLNGGMGATAACDDGE